MNNYSNPQEGNSLFVTKSTCTEFLWTGEPAICTMVQSIQESICGSEWFARQIIEEQEHTEKHTYYILTLDSENVE